MDRKAPVPTDRRISFLSWLSLAGSLAFLVVTLHLLYGIHLMFTLGGILLILVTLSRWRGRVARQESVNGRIRDLEEQVKAHEAKLAQFVAATIKEDKYSVKRLPMAMIVQGSDRLVLCRLHKGEFSGEWQLPAGYADPAKPEFQDLIKKAEKEIRDTLGVDASLLAFRQVLAENFEIAYSNPGINYATIYEYEIASPILSAVLEAKRDCRVIDLRRIEEESAKFDGQIALFVYEILERYKGVKYSEEFKARLETGKAIRISQIRENAAKLLKDAEKIIQEAEGNPG